jgi:hypothetical protein
MNDLINVRSGRQKKNSNKGKINKGDAIILMS